MKLVKYLVAMFVFVCASNAVAAWHTSKILTIHTYLNGGVSVYLVDDHQCGSNRISIPGFNRFYTSLLAYEAQGRSVKFVVQSCNGDIGIVDRMVSIN